MPRSAWAVEPREETGDGTESSAMLDRGSGPPGSRRYVIEGNTCLLRLYIARLIYHACFRSRISSDGVSGHEPGTNRGLCLLILSDYCKLKIESIRATATSRTDSIWGISDRNSLGVSKGRSFHVPRESRLRLLRDRGGPGAGACGGGR